MRVLLVEDNQRVAEPLALALNRQGHEVLEVSTAEGALTAPPVDLVLLDLGLPDRDGIEVCRSLRAAGSEAGIIILTARGEERDRIVGLRSGADDYLVKPFSLAELAARIEAVMRRARPRPAHRRTFGRLQLDLSARRASRDGVRIPLTRKEFELLAALARHPGVVVSRERLLIDVWRTAWRGANRTLDVHIATLRAKLDGAVVIETLRGVGYRLVQPPPD
ncbi:response regulator transcription factor [Micromonospora maritima]|uniref:Response regulator transcription factor n=1 Tax=Micromonospora maritima TaxID=986711 RepID=A0ABW7ZKC2_9ACTN